MKKRNQIGILFLIMLSSITACSLKNESTENAATRLTQTKHPGNDKKEETRTQTMEAFFELTQKKESQIPEVALYMKENISQCSPKDMSDMLLGLEELQQQRKLHQEELLYSAKVQDGLRDLDATGIDLNQTDYVTDQTLVQLISQTRESGYRIVEEKGRYIPIVDYTFYKPYGAYATLDMKEYCKLMAVESSTPYSQDGLLMISWDELMNRAILFEQFLREYPDSSRAEAVRERYDRYIYLALFGLPATPLFDEQTGEMVDDARYSYEKAITSNLESEFLQIIRRFLQIVATNEYKQTEDVEAVCEELIYQLGIEPEQPSRYEAAGIDDAAEFEQTFQMLQIAMKSWDQATIAEYVNYPVKVMIEGETVEIANEGMFKEHYGQIVNEKVKTAFLNQDLEAAGIDKYGVRIGDGRVWLSSRPGTKHKYSINKIENQ